MAQLDRSFVRLRFSLGKAEVKGRQRYANTAAYTAGKVAVAYADEMWEQARDKLKNQVDEDVRRELTHTAYLFRRHINQLGGNRSGTISNVLGGAEPLALSAALPPWAPRGAEYLARKRDAGAGNKWFNNTGWKTRKRPGQSAPYPHDPGRLVQEIRASLFEHTYGPIRVTVVRDNKTAQHNAQAYIALGSQQPMKVQVASIRVSALNRITPGVLEVLRTKRFGDVNPALPRMIRSSGVPFAKEISERLGPTSAGRHRPGQHGVYRPTLEPFLGYFLTRSIPAAVARRIKQGSLGRLTR